MKSRKQLILTILGALGALALSGCDQAMDVAETVVGKHDMPSPTLVLPPGYKIVINGQDIPIHGFDECPRQDDLMSKIFGPTLNEGNMNCVSLSEERLTVPVRLFFSEGYVDEKWEIIHKTGESDNGSNYQQVSLHRPNGMPVIPTSY